MTDVNLIDLLDCDIFSDIQKYLKLKDLFNLRCVNRKFQNYIGNELRVLKRIELQKTDDSVVNTFKVLSENCSNLENINLNRNHWLTDELLLPLLNRNVNTLKSLSLNDCANLTAVSIHPVIISCRKLEKLNLQKCCWLTIGSIETFTFHQENLKELDLAYCDTLTELNILILINKFRKLQIFNLAGIRNVTDNVLFSIATNLPDVKHLNLFNCVAITDKGIIWLYQNLHKLESLSVRGCVNLTEKSLALLRTKGVHIDRPQNASNNNQQRIAFMNEQVQMFNRIANIYLQV